MANCLYAVLVLAGIFIPAKSAPTPAELSTLNTFAALLTYHEAQQGFPFTNWSQIEEKIDLKELNRTLAKSAACPLQQHYTLFTSPLPIPNPKQGELVAVRDHPRKDGWFRSERYAILRKNARITVEVFTERTFQTLVRNPDFNASPEIVKLRTRSELLLPMSLAFVGVAAILVVFAFSRWKTSKIK
jgi:hypothetical protein